MRETFWGSRRHLTPQMGMAHLTRWGRGSPGRAAVRVVLSELPVQPQASCDGESRESSCPRPSSSCSGETAAEASAVLP